MPRFISGFGLGYRVKRINKQDFPPLVAATGRAVKSSIAYLPADPIQPPPTRLSEKGSHSPKPQGYICLSNRLHATCTTMPALSNVALTYDVCVHTSATDFLEAAEHALLADQERRSNLILAHALERASWEAHTAIGASATTLGWPPYERSKAWWARRYSPGQPTVEVGRDFWVTCWTVQTPVTSSARSPETASAAHTARLPTLDFAVSILASDPIFVFTPHLATSLSPSFLAPRAGRLVQRLAQHMPAARMSRLFALYPVAETIAEAWTAYTGIPRAPESQCNVFSTFCTVATFPGVQPLPDGHRVVLANTSQVSHIARLYHDFETELALHPISNEQARQKVERMIQQRQLWIYEYPVLNTAKTHIECYNICAIAALARHTPAVAAISSIYTLPSARGRGIAGHLVSQICNHVFATNKSAVLFVPQGNTVASNFLGRIGFYGMGLRATFGEVAETWREIGFVGGARVSGGW